MVTFVVVGYVAAFAAECVWLHRYFRRCQRSAGGEVTKTA
jgi:hypothetical protein